MMNRCNILTPEEIAALSREQILRIIAACEHIIVRHEEHDKEDGLMIMDDGLAVTLSGPWGAASEQAGAAREAAKTAWNIENERLQRAIENNNARYQCALADVSRASDEMMKDAEDKKQLALAEIQKAYREMGMETEDEQ
jgi:hypothetical protein